MLSQIPGVSMNTAKAILEKFGSVTLLITALNKDKKCLIDIKYKTKTDKERRISNTSIKNIIEYLLYTGI
jgi:excinuclease UvrABC nuclease subunit